MSKLDPFIMFNGNCEEALNFYTGVLNGKVETLMRYDRAPQPVKEEDKHKIMWSAFVFGNGNRFLAADGMSEHPIQTGNHMHMHVYLDSKEEISDVYNKLSQDGKVSWKLSEGPGESQFAMLTDKFGINWMLFLNPGENL